MVHGQDRVCEGIIYKTEASYIEGDLVYLLAYHAFVDIVLDSIHFNLGDFETKIQLMFIT